ncbi:hypothetical protein GPECTOR_33g585 [Gonium pectorale]|uniref:Uncharacterized protein n=1 Tax=Gonium pectorale TaxID=33097 RepID=A0A150GD47_GONPE|nr:hypothetical protein GPECTOR_33g585 [Gonium pectorale]|eukprot:KXZ47703.1 hypothetical protein GPECTOR_33g585 [Gonium pectorale]
MMNRIAFLAQEELRLDRDIEAARRRAAEALARQATKDQDIAATAKEVLAVLPAAPPTKIRPHTGRTSLIGGGGSGGMQHLSGPAAGGSSGHGSDLDGSLGAGASGQGPGGGRNAMSVLHGGTTGAHGAELDGEVLEELAAGSRAAAGGAGLGGLQEFATEGGGGGRRVVQVKAAAARKGEGATVAAAGVGWGLGGRAGGGAAIPPREAAQLAAEMAKKQGIWKVRRTFGLEAAPLTDRTAQVEELGSGAWQ